MGGFTQNPWTPTKRRGNISAEFTSPGPACVSLQNTIGQTPNDSKKGRAPAFSFGSRHSNKNNSPGPGPGQYNITGLSAKGKDTPPAATLHSRPKDGKSEATPAPGDYNPEKAEKVVHGATPKYTFGLKTQVEKVSSSPAPGTYCPENCITALDTTPKYSFGHRTQLEKPSDVPAPGTYAPEKCVTSLDTTPKYTFGHRTQLEKPSDVPAPGTYAPEKFVTSLDTTPKYTFGHRTQLEKPSDVPAPGAYAPEKCVTALDTTPKYSFGLKTQIEKPNGVPAPGAYCPEKFVGALDTTPKYSFGHRTQLEKPSEVPAPGTYSLDTVDTTPKYSFGLKTQIEKPNGVPAPGAYSPEKYVTALDTTPKYSFGLKTQLEKPSDVPAPCAYSPENLDNTPKYSFGLKTQLEKPNGVPAPGAYSPEKFVTALDTTPKYSFGLKTQLEKPSDVPSPCAYNPENLDNTPKYSFGLKTQIEKPNGVPAPGAYSPEKFVTALDTTPKYSFGLKTQLEKPSDVPSPCAYNPENLDNTPKYSFGLKTQLEKPNGVPAPGAYSPEKFVTALDTTPKYSFGLKTQLEKPSDVPSPCAYNPENLDNTPKYSFGLKTQIEKPNGVPAPGAYSPEKFVTALDTTPKYSFGLKTQLEKPSDVPAPGAYCPEKYITALDATPKYTFGHRTQLEKPSDTPAPGQYEPEKHFNSLDTTPKYSFGVKTQVEKPSDTPAPGTYKIERSNTIILYDASPKFSFGTRPVIDKPSDNPAPNVYNIPPVLGQTKEGNKASAPAYTMTSRQKVHPDDRIIVPGPGAYNNSLPDVYNNKLKFPSFSIRSRCTIPTDDVHKPGPGAHCPEKQANAAYIIAMGTPAKEKQILEAWRNEDIVEFKSALKEEGVKTSYLYVEEGYSTILEIIASDPKPGCEEYIKLALEHGAPVNLKNVMTGRTALIAAVQRLNVAAVEALLAVDADVTCTDDKGNNCLHLLARAVPEKDEGALLRCVDLLLQKPNVPLNEVNKKGFTPVVSACNKGAWRVVVKLLGQGSRLDIDSKLIGDQDQKSARELITSRRQDLVDLLPPVDASPSPQEWSLGLDGSLLFNLLYGNHENRFCAAFTKEMEKRDHKQLLAYHDGYNTFLQYSASHGLYKAAKTLLLMGADVNEDKPLGRRPIHLACQQGDSAMVKTLLDHDADLSPDGSGQTVLHILAQVDGFSEKHSECLKKILQKKLDVNKFDNFGKTPLHYATDFPNTAAVRLILDNGADMFVDDEKGNSALASIPAEDLEAFFDSKISWNGRRCDECKLWVDVDFLKPKVYKKRQKDVQPLWHEFALNNDHPEMSGLLKLSKLPHLSHLLAHPVLSCFITQKWSLIRPFYYGEVLFYAIFYLLFTYYAFLMSTEFPNVILVAFLRVVLIFFLVLRYFQTILAAAATPYGFAKNPQRWTNAIFTIIATIVLAKDASHGFEIDSPWFRLYPQFTCSALFSSCIQFSLLLAEHPCLALSYSIMGAVIKRCLQVFAVYFAFILSFKAIFSVLTHFYCKEGPCKPFSLFFIPFEIPLNTSGAIGVEKNSIVMFTLFSIIVTALVVHSFALAIIDCQNLMKNSQFSTLQQQVTLIASLEETLVSSPRARFKHFSRYLSRELVLPSYLKRLSKKILFFSKGDGRLVLFPNRDNTITTMQVKNKPQAWWNARARLKRKVVFDLEKRVNIQFEDDDKDDGDVVLSQKVDSLIDNFKHISAKLEDVEETGKQSEKLLIQSLAIASLQQNEQRQ